MALAGSIDGVLVVEQVGRAADDSVVDTVERLYEASHSAGRAA